MVLTVRAASYIKATTRPGLAHSAKIISLTEAKIRLTKEVETTIFCNLPQRTNKFVEENIKKVGKVFFLLLFNETQEK